MNKDSSKFPVGYLRCKYCNNAALWLVDNYETAAKPTKDSAGNDDVIVKLSYRLIGYKHPSINPLVKYCDSCNKRVEEDNFDEEYLIFIKAGPSIIC